MVFKGLSWNSLVHFQELIIILQHRRVLQSAGMLETISLQKFNYSPIHRGNNAYKRRVNFITKVNLSSAIKPSPSVLQSRCKSPDSWLTQENTIGIIGGLSAIATQIFLEKLVFWSSRNTKEHIPFVVCSDPAIRKEILVQITAQNGNSAGKNERNTGLVAENLLQKRLFLEKSGARCIVMPCHISHLWYRHVSRGCSVPFLDVGECVARELKEANLKPVEAGSNVRIGVLAADSALVGSFYQEKLHSQVPQNSFYKSKLQTTCHIEHKHITQ